ncbi:condensation domain-containing protein [Nocardia higoensis]|uniref:condensation domain-containing protein n=1 Tax=Nocardia higoensis TaxID=228599 RepID=UPI0002DAEAAD|nr:condensation domain-containing protein [Nocardia higoensis]
MNALTDARLELLRRRMAAAGIASESAAGAAPVAAPAQPGTGEFGIAERRMWKIYEFDQDSVSHNIALVLDFGDTYRLDALIASTELMIGKAAVLGSIVTVGADGVARRVPSGVRGRWAEPGRVWEYGTLPAYDGRTDRDSVLAVADALARSPFALTQEPPLRVRLYPRAGGGVTMLLVVHHLAVDDTSWPALLGTLTTGAWPEQAAGATDRPVAAVADALRHAQQTWAAEDVRFPLSGELPSISAEESWLSPMDECAGEKLYAPVEPEHHAALDAVAREVGATGNALYITLCALGVYALTGAADHVLLVPADNRRPGDTPDRVGYSGNIVPMRFSFDPASSLREALRAGVSAVYAAMEYATVDYGAVLTALRGAGGRFPVAEIMASVRNAPLRGIPVPAGASVTCRSVFNGIGNYPLTFAFEIGADEQVHLEVDYQTEVVDEEFAHRAAAVLTGLIERVPDRLDTEVGQLVSALREPEAV